MRKFFSFIAIFAVLSFASTAMAQDAVKRIVGKHVQMGTYSGSNATLDAFSFGFESKMIRVCMKPQSAVAYFRFGTATADRSNSSETSYTGGSYVAIDYTADRMTVPASSSSVFISGQSGSYAFGPALPMYASADTNGASGYMCTEQPWRTKGIVTHIASGLATIDIWAW